MQLYSPPSVFDTKLRLGLAAARVSKMSTASGITNRIEPSQCGNHVRFPYLPRSQTSLPRTITITSTTECFLPMLMQILPMQRDGGTSLSISSTT